MTTVVFEEHRSALTGVAYRVLGTASGAEDTAEAQRVGTAWQKDAPAAGSATWSEMWSSRGRV